MKRSENRDKAYELWLNYKGDISLKEIATKIGVSDSLVRKWKSQDKWALEVRADSNGNVTVKDGNVTKKPGPPYGNNNAEGFGAPIGNDNAVGNNGGPPKGNQNALKHGLFAKYLPAETLEIAQGISKISPIDILWSNICIKHAAILRAQKIMFVKDQEDLTKELKRQKESVGESSESWEKEYELQFAWDKQASFLQAQSTAMRTLTNMIKEYEELCKSELATEEQRLRVAKLKAEVDNLQSGNQDDDVKIIDDLEVEGNADKAE